MCIFDRPATMIKINKEIEGHTIFDGTRDKEYLSKLVAAAKAVREQERINRENTKENQA